MAKKWYRSLIEDDGDPRGVILVGGARPGEVFQFDYDQPGYDVKALLEGGVIAEAAKPTKADADAAGKA